MRLAVLLATLAISLTAHAQGGRFPAEIIAPPLYMQALEAEKSDMAKAVRLYVRDAEMGNANAALRLAELHETGAPGTAPDLEEASRWRRAATVAAAKHSPAYVEGVAAENLRNGAQAVRLYVRAARAGDSKAAVRLSAIFDRGIEGVSRDYAESLKWRNAARVLGEPFIGDFRTSNERPRDQRLPQR